MSATSDEGKYITNKTGGRRVWPPERRQFVEDLTEEQMKILLDKLESKKEALKDAVILLGKIICEALKPLIVYLNGLEPYQKFEIMHPRKKPRGSIRRYKRKMRGERRK